MNFKIIKAEIFKYQATQKTIWLFTKLEDNNNVVGWGEATLQGRENEILQNKKVVFELIVNKNFKSPYDLKILLPFTNIIEASISSSIMQAIWDIHARQNKQSIANMFSPKNYGYISTYANFNRVCVNRDLDTIKAVLKQVVNDGFKAIKFAPFDEVNPKMSFQEMIKNVENGFKRISIINENINKDIKLMIDCHWRFTSKVVLDLVSEFSNFNLYWLESPIDEEIQNIPQLKIIKEKLNHKGIKLAGLENKILKQGFEEFIKQNSHDVMMPDVKYAGGPDEMFKINKFLSKNNIEFSPHNPSGPIAHAHSIQICSVSSSPFLEYQYKETEKFHSIVSPHNQKIINGLIKTDFSDYGLGLHVNEVELTKL